MQLQAMLMVIEEKIFTAGKTRVAIALVCLVWQETEDSLPPLFRLTLLAVLHSLAKRRHSNVQKQTLLTEIVFTVTVFSSQN